MKKLLISGFTLLAFFVTQAQVPALSSYNAASAVVFLDFDGQTVDGTSWNSNGPIFCAPSGLDNIKITSIFNRVSEDYRPFNINITTDSTKFLAAPINKRMRVIITTSSSWYGNAGGVAFLGSFTWGDDTPCFVFSALLANNEKYIAEAAAHEAGHTLGLYHQSAYDANCVKTSEYNGGIGTGEIAWAPIMGVGYYKNMTLWHNGANPYGCNNLQNDLTILTSNNGFSYRTDDYTNNISLAPTQAFTNNQFVVNGIVENTTDIDLIKFNLPVTARFQLDAIPYNVGTGNSGSDVDLQVSLFNSQRTLISTFNPGTLLSSIMDTTLSSGSWYLQVEGKGNEYAPDYASLGSYSLSGRYSIGGVLPLRQLKLQGQMMGDRHQLNWLIDADEPVAEQVLEVAVDGRNFSALASPPINARTYQYKPDAAGMLQYRMKVRFDQGETHYSNIIALKSDAGNDPPKLISNFLNGNIISVSSPGHYAYALYDLNGRLLIRGQLSAGINNLSAGQLRSGMYLIRFSQGASQWAEKLVHQ